MFRDNMQRLLNFCSPAAVPTEWNVQLWTWIDLDIFYSYNLVIVDIHLVTVGKTVHMGLGLEALSYRS